jgi:hypothetical protein
MLDIAAAVKIEAISADIGVPMNSQPSGNRANATPTSPPISPPEIPEVTPRGAAVAAPAMAGEIISTIVAEPPPIPIITAIVRPKRLPTIAPIDPVIVKCAIIGSNLLYQLL